MAFQTGRLHHPVGSGEQLNLAIMIADSDVEKLQSVLSRVVLLQPFTGLDLRLHQHAAPVLTPNQLVNRVGRHTIEGADLNEEEVVFLAVVGQHKLQQIEYLQVGLLLKEPRLPRSGGGSIRVNPPVVPKNW